MNKILNTMSLLLVLLLCGQLQAEEMRIARALTSPFGHTVFVGEIDDKNGPETHLSLSFANKICIKGIMNFKGTSNQIKLGWKADHVLVLQIPQEIDSVTEFPNGYLECEQQKVDITIILTRNVPPKID